MNLNKPVNQLLFPELEQAIELIDRDAIDVLCEQLSVEDFAELVEDLTPKHRSLLFEAIPPKIATDIFQQLGVGEQREILDSLSSPRVAEIINEIDPDDRTALLESLPIHATKQLLSFLKPLERAIAQKLLAFPEDSVGRLMTPDFLAILRGWTVAQALDYIRKNGEDKETLNDIYVVDGQGRLLDDILIREFLLSPLDRSVEDIRDGQFTSLHALEPKENAIQAFKKYNNRTALPVIDEEGVLLGIVTIDDILLLEEKETTEDIQMLGGVQALTDSYLEISFWGMFQKRGGWLLVLFLGQMLTTSAMSFFQVEISKAVILALFVPLIISSGGNSGSQAATLVIRALALGEVLYSDLWKVLRRELLVGFSLGAALGFVGLLRVFIWGATTGDYGDHYIQLGISVCASVVCVVTWGTLVGAMLPLLLKRFGLDPATSSAPFVATLIDITGILIYFNIVLWVMQGKLF